MTLEAFTFLFQAEDPDTMDEGKLTYSLLPESMYVYTVPYFFVSYIVMLVDPNNTTEQREPVFQTGVL